MVMASGSDDLRVVMGPALQQWMAMVLGLLSLRSEAGQVIYAMRSRPQSTSKSAAKNWPQAARAARSVLPPQHLLLDTSTALWARVG